MGTSIPNSKEKEIICSNCLSQCDAYLRSNSPAYSPRKSHKIPFECRAHTETLYQFCIHYEPFK